MARLGAAALAAIFALAACRRETLELSGTVEARRVTVSARITATLLELHADEGDAVEAGALLAELDCEVQRAALERARAESSQAAAELELLRAGSRPQEIAAAEARVRAADAELRLAHLGAREEEIDQLEASLAENAARARLAELSWERANVLVESGAAPQASADAARAELDALAAERERLEASLAEAKAGARPEEIEALEQRHLQLQAELALLREGARAQEIEAAEARLAAARAALAGAEVELTWCRLAAPVAGSVEIVDYEPGELLPQGAPLIAIARAGPLRVRTYAPQRVIGSLQVGDRLPVAVDAHPDRPVEARVERIWDEAELSAGNVQTPEDRMLLLYRVDLEVEPAPEIGLRPGANVLVDFGHPRR
jgi:multidrug resistance efflux pump